MRRALLRILRFLTRRLAGLDMGDPREFSAERQRQAVIHSTTVYDMSTEPDEQYYSAQYWHWIERCLNQAKVPATGRMLDLGCGQGRLTGQLAAHFPGAQITGVDISGPAIAKARDIAAQRQLSNVNYEHASIESSLESQAAASADLVLFCEVSFFFPAWRSAIDHIARILKPGGVLCVSFRPQYFDALMLARMQLFENTEMLLERREGRLFGGETLFTWQTAAEIRVLMESELNMHLLKIAGIGCCSGIAGDPHAGIARPSLLSDDDRDDLMRIELAIGEQNPDAGRYVLAIAQKQRGLH